MKFLHISDVHLGCTRYQLAESQRDFFDAWMDVLRRYAIGENVDFVLMAGDFFHKRSVPPETMNYAFAGLSMLKDRGIPVYAIEGNHDQKHRDSEYSWLRSLENWRLLHLLEPKATSEGFVFEPWDYDRRDYVRGGYADIGRVRIFGSAWYGVTANLAIPRIVEAIRPLRREGAFHILMLHTDVEGHQTHPLPALSLEKLRELRSVTDYVAIGHTHKCYEIDNWAFNPGSLEITKIDEFRETRGAWLVEIGDDNSVNARHVNDYTQRPFQRLQADVSGIPDAAQVNALVLETADREGRRATESEPLPIIEMTLRGHLGFPNSLLDLSSMRDQIRRITGALHVRMRNHTVPVDYAVAADMDPGATRENLERRVVEDLIARDNRFQGRAAEIAEAVIGAKRLVLSEEDPEKIAEFIELKTL